MGQLSDQSSLCSRNLPDFPTARVYMSAPGMSLATGITEIRLEPLDSSAPVDIVSLDIRRHTEAPCFHSHFGHFFAKRGVFAFTPFSYYCNKGHGLDTHEHQKNGMLISPIFFYT